MRFSPSSPSSSRYSNPASPRALAFAIALYSYVALFGMLAFGREKWCERGEGFAVLFAYIARIAPLHARDGRIRLRMPLSGLAGSEHVPGSVVFVAVALGSVGFDGFSRTTKWQNLIARVEAPYVLNRPGTGELLVTGVNLLGLFGAIVLVLCAFLAACWVARRMVNAPRSLTPEFVLSLVPIALVYAVAHYFSLFVIQGQYMAPLLSDPFGKGWDLFGTANVIPNIALLTPNTIWYVQVGSLVAGHVAGLAVAHDRAVTIFERPPGRPPQPVRDAGADGALHGRRALAALARMILAHGGIPGLIAETLIGLTVAALLGSIWLRERRRRARARVGRAGIGRRRRCATGNDEARVEQHDGRGREQGRLRLPEARERTADAQRRRARRG